MTDQEIIANNKHVIRSKFPKKIARKILANIYARSLIGHNFNFHNNTLPHRIIMNAFNWADSLEARKPHALKWHRYHDKLTRREL